jgi:hypothetical protein
MSSSSLRRRLPSTREAVTFITALIVWLAVTAIFVGLRPEHPVMALLMAAMFFAAPAPRALLMALLPFALFGISYDWMNIVPNYTVNPVDTIGLYSTELRLFGIHGLTPNEWCAQHTSPVLDLLGGVFYLCWVPVPIAFGIYLYCKGQRTEYLHFALVFLLTNLIGFTVYYVHPAAPPWFVRDYGFEPTLGLPGSSAGLAKFDAMVGLPIFDTLYARNANVFAALPSLHSAYTLLAFIYSLRAKVPAWMRIALAIITLGIWSTAVYTFHHYLTDVICGIACALFTVVLFELVLMRIPAFSRFISRYINYITPRKS